MANSPAVHRETAGTPHSRGAAGDQHGTPKLLIALIHARQYRSICPMIAKSFMKYGALATNWTYGSPRPTAIRPDLRCSWLRVDQIGEQQSRDAWQEAFGTFEWDHLRGGRATILVFSTDTTDVSNATNEELMNRVRLASFAYLLNRPPVNSGGYFWLISGDADANREPVSLRNWARLPELFLPYFIQRQPFGRTLQQFQSNDWIADWCTDIALLDAARGGQWLISPPVEMALLSLLDASINSTIDFRIPSLVRTIEALVAIPRAQGAATFAQRAALFAGEAIADPGFVATAGGRTPDQVLRDLFQLRSDAVHGKWPMRDMQQAGREDEVALLDFTAETIARAVIKWALLNSGVLQTYQTRALLEAAWASNSVPPP